MDWFRWYAGTTTNPKWQVVSVDSGQPVAVVIAIWAHILERANATNGTLEGWNSRVVAVSLGVSADAVNSVVDAMQGLVLQGHEVKGWSQKQPKRRDDHSTLRVRAMREKQSDETHMKRGETQRNAMKRNETLEESREEKKEEDADASSKKEAGATKRGSRLPDGAMLPDEWKAFAQAEGHPNPEREWAKFTDHWRAQPGQKGVKLDWEATWRNWIRKAVEDGRRGGNRQQGLFGSSFEQARRTTAEALAEFVGRG